MKHLLAFGQIADLVHVLLTNRLSFKRGDFDGELLSALKNSRQGGYKLVQDATHVALEVR